MCTVCIQVMVLILDGNLEHENKSFRKNLNKNAFIQIKLQRLLLTSAPIPELPSNISTMVHVSMHSKRIMK